ncbi:hypothetical protein BDW59DRAFT_58760 [Aspergillus cavernicola]|uniref:Uncharacterized protein n=1 Tax=Aspergillus cavernicola TaxID=176166 RepID=A0ABR4IHJ6_9EURO
MAIKRFLPFHLLDPDHFLPLDKNRCAAILENGERCDGVISQCDLEAIRDIYVEYEYEDEDEDEDAEFLVKLAKLCLCSEEHNTKRNVKAAVQQWMKAKTSTDSDPNRKDPLPPASATRETGKESLNKKPLVLFKFEKDTNARKALADATFTDQKVRQALEATSSPSIPKYIYLMSHEAAKGRYKISYKASETSPLPNPTCYPGSEPYCCIECPDVKRIQALVLAEFAAQRCDHLCEEPDCKVEKKHIRWIEADGEDIKASIVAWMELVQTGYTDSQIPEDGFSKEMNRWTKWAQETVAEIVASRKPELPPRPVNLVSQEPSDTSFSSEDSIFSDAPPPSTPTTITSAHDESFTSTTTDSSTKSAERPRFLKGYLKPKFASVVNSAKRRISDFGRDKGARQT